MSQDQDEHVFLYYRSPARIRQESFSHRVRGLDESEVREFLDLLADQVQAAEWERAQLLAELEELRRKLAQLEGEAEHQQPRPVEPAPSPVDDTSPHVAAVLNQAQAVADQLVAEAERRAERMLAAARNEGRDVVRRARETAYDQLRTLFESLDGEFDRLGRAVAPDALTGPR